MISRYRASTPRRETAPSSATRYCRQLTQASLDHGTGRGMCWPGRAGVVSVVISLPPVSGRVPADEPDGGGDEQERQREQPAALDPLERPEPAARLVARQLRKA